MAGMCKVRTRPYGKSLLLADIVAIIGLLDIVFGEVDR